MLKRVRNIALAVLVVGIFSAALSTTALEPIPDKLVVLTFDDSKASHYTVVRPLLKKYGFAATFFITEGFTFRTNKDDYLTWEQIAELHRDGFEIGNHTRDHIGASKANLGKLREQIAAINAQCAAHGIPAPTSFAYPGNAIDPGALPILEELGFRFARRGGAPEYPYEEGNGFAYEPGRDHPLLLPSAGDARPAWTLENLKRALSQATNGRIAVLQFHGAPDVEHPWVHTPRERFEEYMKYLHDNGYKAVAMRDLARYVDWRQKPADPWAVIEQRKNRVTGGAVSPQTAKPDPLKFLTQPLISGIYTADPSAHVFNGRIFIYPSHDIDAGVKPDDLGSHFAMRDYHVFSMDDVGGKVLDHDVALDIKDVPWAGRQMWAPDAAEKNGKYYLYFPAKDKQDVFRIGVAIGDKPEGPFTAHPTPIAGSYSIDPAVFKDSDGRYYLYFGGIWGGQLQRWATGSYVAKDVYPSGTQPALTPKVARLADDMIGFAETPRNVVIQDDQQKPLPAADNARRFFEAAWLHKYNGTYYLSYSTGDTHFIVYATGQSPYGPFTVRGKILEPVLGWTNHHSIVEFRGKWYLFYHDAQLSGGQTHLRNIKVTELTHRPDGSIETIDAYFQ